MSSITPAAGGEQRASQGAAEIQILEAGREYWDGRLSQITFDDGALEVRMHPCLIGTSHAPAAHRAVPRFVSEANADSPRVLDGSNDAARCTAPIRLPRAVSESSASRPGET